jgi:hypothetical protein
MRFFFLSNAHVAELLYTFSPWRAFVTTRRKTFEMAVRASAMGGRRSAHLSSPVT